MPQDEAEAARLEDRTYSVEEVAKVLLVAKRTMFRWIYSGRMKAYYDMQTGAHRIPRIFLILFMEEYGMPISRLLDWEASVTPAATPTESE